MTTSKQPTLGNFMKNPSGGAAKSASRQPDIGSAFKKNASSSSKTPGHSSDAVKASNGSKKADVDDGDGMTDSDEEMVAASSSARNTAKKRKVIDSDSDSEVEIIKPQPSLKKAAINGKVESKSKIVEPVASSSKSPVRSESRSASPEEDKEDRKSHVKIAEIFKKPSEREADASAAGTSWKAGQPIPYAAMADVFSRIEATTKRLEIQAILSDFFLKVMTRATKPEEVTQVVYLCINRLCPDYIGMELGLGEGLLIKALAQSFGREVPKIKKDLEAKGDLGLVAVASRAKQPTMFKSSALTVPGVFSQLREIATLSGAKSQDRKLGVIKKMLASCKGDETKWIIRSLEGKLRIGLAEKTVIIGLAHSAVLHRLGKKRDKMSSEDLSAELEKGTALVKAVYSEMPNYDRLVPSLLETGPEGLRESCQLTPGIPLKPMLAKPTKAITEVLDRFEGKEFTCEYKYDGERAQVHFYVPGEAVGADGQDAGPQTSVQAPGEKKGKLGVFSRNSEDMSVKYPDLLESIPHFVKPGTKSFVLDAEVTAWKKREVDAEGKVIDEGGLLPFQRLSTRKRKDVEVKNITVRVKLFAFDLLYVNGVSLLHEDFATRRAKLREHFQAVEDEFDFATSQDCTTVEEIQTFLDASVADRCEGLMVKMMTGTDSFYEPSRRSMNWLKLKKDYLSGTGDSLDLVVLGGYFGKGKRTQVYGAFLLGCWDADSETYQTVCKIGTGFSEENLENFTQILKPLQLATKKPYYDVGQAKPDVFFEAKIVWEVLTADLSLSPVYSAAKGLVESRGISLRFPRFIRIRDDKEPDDSTSPEQIVEMYRAQAVAAKGGGGGGVGEDDYW